ncbi:MAG TPA: hypothetical protein VHZ24_09965 [Pirellulales bacterium]|nr:hypothetical protein [Pirellulales bacterium]
MDIFDQLTTAEVPPLPDSFDGDVHHRLNNRLLGLHVAELFSKAAVFGLLHFARAWLGLLIYTFSGRYPVERRTDGHHDRRDHLPPRS